MRWGAKLLQAQKAGRNGLRLARSRGSSAHETADGASDAIHRPGEEGARPVQRLNLRVRYSIVAKRERKKREEGGALPLDEVESYRVAGHLVLTSVVRRWPSEMPSHPRQLEGGISTVNQIIVVGPARNIKIKLAPHVFGLSENAVRSKIKRGDWLEGKEYTRDPDGGVWLIVEGVNRWVEKRTLR